MRGTAIQYVGIDVHQSTLCATFGAHVHTTRSLHGVRPRPRSRSERSPAEDLALDPFANFAPIRRHSFARIESRAPKLNLGSPSRIYVRVGLRIEALNQTSCKVRSFRLGEFECFVKQVLCSVSHVLSLLHQTPSSAAGADGHRSTTLVVRYSCACGGRGSAANR